MTRVFFFFFSSFQLFFFLSFRVCRRLYPKGENETVGLLYHFFFFFIRIRFYTDKRGTRSTNDVIGPGHFSSVTMLFFFFFNIIYLDVKKNPRLPSSRFNPFSGRRHFVVFFYTCAGVPVFFFMHYAIYTLLKKKNRSPSGNTTIASRRVIGGLGHFRA